MSNLETETVVKNGADAPVKDNSMVAQFEKLIDSIIDAKVQEAIQHMELVSEDRLRDVLSEEIRNELEAQEVPDLYGVRDIVQEELDNVEWADRFDVGGAVDDALGDDYVKRDELDSALDELSISRG